MKNMLATTINQLMMIAMIVIRKKKKSKKDKKKKIIRIRKNIKKLAKNQNGKLN